MKQHLIAALTDRADRWRTLLFIAVLFSGSLSAANPGTFVSESPLRRVEYWQLRAEAINAELETVPQCPR